ncbi:LysR family transcriptional regulator [Bdellovibrio sp. HCB337]|uniref:LysR family transcriptional regulator n=1 Tax=Bdellovibrio sp. HCB337 TaxID=3394358 RepID=UPI0039A6B514
MSLLSPPLKAFLAVVDKTTVMGAAESLGIVQTAVTQRIRSLESELGVTLFIRSRKGMALTTEGHALLKYCLGAKELEGKTFAELHKGGIETDVELRIAGPTSFISGRVVPQCRDIFKKWPRLNLQFIIDDSENRLDLIKTGKADIVVLYPHQVPLELDSKVVKPDEYCLLGHPSWKDRDLKDILENERLFAFHADDHTSLNYLKTFNLLKYLKRPRLFANENLALSTLLCAGVGFGLLEQQIAEPLIEKKKLIKLNQGKTLKDPLALAWYPRTEMPDYFQEIVRVIK